MIKRKILATWGLWLLSASLATSVTLAAAGARGGRGGRGEFGATNIGPRGPAPTLVVPTTPSTKPDGDGFIRRWLLLEPIAGQGMAESDFKEAVKKEEFLKELTALPHDGDKMTVDGAQVAWHAYDTNHYNVNLFHFAYALNKPTRNVIWWVETVVEAPEEMKNVRLAIGSNDASIWWLNGEQLIGLFGNRMDTFDDGVSKKVTLKKGLNVIRAAVGNEMGPSDFCARILDSNDDPVLNFTVRLPAMAK